MHAEWRRHQRRGRERLPHLHAFAVVPGVAEVARDPEVARPARERGASRRQQRAHAQSRIDGLLTCMQELILVGIHN